MNLRDLFRKKKIADQPQPVPEKNTETGTVSKARPENVVINGQLYSACENCGTPVDAYGRIQQACNLMGKRLCPSCFGLLRKTTIVVCEKCGKTIPYLEMTRHLCADCWKEHLSELRRFYGEYHARLLDVLRKHGVSALPAGTEYADESGRAAFPVIPSSADCIPLRKDIHGYYGGDECAIFTVKARDAIFALPDNGIGIRYLKASCDNAFMDRAYCLERGYILAVASDGNDLFVLNDRGSVVSTRQDWKSDQLFDVLEEVRGITHHYFSESEISAAVSRYERGIESKIADRITYDSRQKAFIEYYDNGNSHEGIERVYSERSRLAVLQHLIKYRFSFRETVLSARNGKIPIITIVEQLAVHDGDTEIQVPESEWVY